MDTQILPFSVTFGDWSGDGHGISDTEEIEIHYRGHAQLTETMILENYQANVAKLGFGLPELWADYEQFSPTADQILAMENYLGIMIFNSDDDGFEPDEDILSLDLAEVGSELQLAMFLVLHGFHGSSWRKVFKSPSLFGNAGSLLTENKHVGYGLKSA